MRGVAVFSVRGGSAEDIVCFFCDTYAVNQLLDDSMVCRRRREFLTGYTSSQDGVYRERGTLDDNFFTHHTLQILPPVTFGHFLCSKATWEENASKLTLRCSLL